MHTINHTVTLQQQEYFYLGSVDFSSKENTEEAKELL